MLCSQVLANINVEILSTVSYSLTILDIWFNRQLDLRASRLREAPHFVRLFNYRHVSLQRATKIAFKSLHLISLYVWLDNDLGTCETTNR